MLRSPSSTFYLHGYSHIWTSDPWPLIFLISILVWVPCSLVRVLVVAIIVVVVFIVVVVELFVLAIEVLKVSFLVIFISVVLQLFLSPLYL